MINRIDIADALAMLTGNASDKTPAPSEVTIQAWLAYFAGHPSWTGDDLVAAANKYCAMPRERLVQPADLGQIIAAWQRDRLDRMDPDARALAMADKATQAEEGFASYDRYGVIDKSAPDDDDYPADWDSARRLKAYWERIDDFAARQERDLAYARPSALSKVRPASPAERAAAIQEFVGGRFGADADGVVEDVPHVNHLAVRCSHCKAQVGYPCTVSSLGSGGQRELLTGAPAHPSRILAAAVDAGFTTNEEGTGSADAIVAAQQRAHARRVRSRWAERDQALTPIAAQSRSNGSGSAGGGDDPAVGVIVAQRGVGGDSAGVGGGPDEE